MALKQAIVLDCGIEITEAYLKISDIVGSKDELIVNLFVYSSQSAYGDGKPLVAARQYAFVPSVADEAPNFIKQAYEHLKTLTEYANSTDC